MSVVEIRSLSLATAAVSDKTRARFEAAGQLTPRERVSLVLDRGAPFLELMAQAGYDGVDPATAGAGQIVGLGFIHGSVVMVAASDAGINAGALSATGREKLVRAQDIALENSLPFIQLVESAGANLLDYRVEDFVLGGALFRNLARLSAAGLPVITVVHGASTAGGAYLPGLSDHVIMVRGRARAYLAGPALLKAATGEVADDEALGGAEMHATLSGLADHVAEDDAEAMAMVRAIFAGLGWDDRTVADATTWEEPSLSPAGLGEVMPADFKTPVDMRRVVERLVDRSAWVEFKPDFGPATLCLTAHLAGQAISIITNNGPIDERGAAKAAHYIQLACQAARPIVYLHNITGFAVGVAHEQGGVIKHGAKLIQAVATATTPQITIHCGASFGAGNFAMCGRGLSPHFAFSWPGARTAVMGGLQAAMTMRTVAEARAARRGEPLDEAAQADRDRKLAALFDDQASALVTSARLLDDGVIDPADTRHVLALVLDVLRRAARRKLNPIQFGVARM